jgi:large subunit ribosomal protein L19
MDQLVREVENQHKKKKAPSFKVGDTVKVHTRIVEGDKERVQVYNGTVVGKKGSGLSETFTVTRIAFGYANEKVFPLHGPSVVKVEVVSNGDVRKSKLNYIRGKLGKAAKISAKLGLTVEGNEEAVEKLVE